MLKKFLLVLFMLFLFPLRANSAIFPYDFAKVISQQDIDGSSTVSIYVKDIKTSKVLYSKNENKLLNTASSLKLFTFASALNTLGNDHKFETAFYIHGGNLYLKLGADPLLSRFDLYELVSKLKKSVDFKNIKYIYIDDKIISNVPYPDGWCIDDFWPSIASISPYIIDGNKVRVRLIISSDRDSINIVQNDKYRFSFINQLQISDENDFDFVKNYSSMQNVITLKGQISHDEDIVIPVSDPKYFFIARLENAFGKYSIPYSDKFYFKEVPNGAKKVASVFHTIDEVSVPILKYSDNFSSEVLFRVAGAKYAKENGIKSFNGLSVGTTKNAIEMFYSFYKNAGLDMRYIKIVDGSGVSRYNAASTKWLVDALIMLDKKKNIRDFMEGADEGTLKKRLRYLKGNLWAKTGTHQGLSSLVGVLKTRKKNDVAFGIIIQCFTKSAKSLKTFEDDIVDCIFNL